MVIPLTTGFSFNILSSTKTFVNLTGPVFVEFPLDVLYPYHLVEREILRNVFPKNLKGKALNW